jgi:alkylhydroperoxidase family enzyme
MARVPLGHGPVAGLTAAVFETFAREGHEPIDLYRALANSPGLLRAYATLARSLRYEAETPRPLRELVILRTAQLTGSPYEWAHHRPMAVAAGVAERKSRRAGAVELERGARPAAALRPRPRLPRQKGSRHAPEQPR